MKKTRNKILSIETLIAIVACGLVIVGVSAVPVRESGTCGMDVIWYVLSYKGTAKIAIIIALYYLIISKNEYWSMLVLQYKNKKDIWTHKCKEVFWIANTFTICLLIISMTYGIITNGMQIYNWMSSDSFLFKNVHKRYPDVVYDSSIIETMLLAYILLFLLISVTLFIMAAGRWIFNSYYMPLIVVVSIAMNDTYTFLPPLLYSRFYIHNEEWLNPGINVVVKLIVLAVMSCGLVIVGIAICRRKEFLDKVQ